MSLDTSVTHTDTATVTYNDTPSDLLAPQSCPEQTTQLQMSQGPFQA